MLWGLVVLGRSEPALAEARRKYILREVPNLAHERIPPKKEEDFKPKTFAPIISHKGPKGKMPMKEQQESNHQDQNWGYDKMAEENALVFSRRNNILPEVPRNEGVSSSGQVK